MDHGLLNTANRSSLDEFILPMNAGATKFGVVDLGMHSLALQLSLVNRAFLVSERVDRVPDTVSGTLVARRVAPEHLAHSLPANAASARRSDPREDLAAL